MLGGLFVALSIGLFGASSASAVSPYDNALQVTDEIFIQDEWNNCDYEEFTLNWTSLISTDTPNVTQEMVDSFNNYTNLGISQRTNTDTEYPYGSFDVFWTEDDSMVADFEMVAGVPSIIASSSNGRNSFWRLTFSYNSTNCTVRQQWAVSAVNTNNQIISTETSVYTDFYKIFFLNINPNNINYPLDYEGEAIPDTWTPPAEPWPFVPDWYVSGAIDWKVAIHDINFNTFDGIQWTCDEGLAPVIHAEIYMINTPDGDVLIDSFVYSATVQFDFQAEKIEADIDYRLTGQYECDDVVGDIIFNDSSSVEFTVTRHGSVFIEMFNDCILEEFPFVDVPACIDNIFILINRLSFNFFFSTDAWKHESSECYTMQVLHTWIGVNGQNAVLCPKFSETVRNTVTPFVTFIFGLITISFVAGRGQHGTRREKV